MSWQEIFFISGKSISESFFNVFIISFGAERAGVAERYSVYKSLFFVVREEISFTVFFNCDSKIVIQSSGEKSVPTLDISKNL